MKTFTIIQDTREKQPFDFSDKENCNRVLVQKIEYGDYSVKGLEHKIFIERKNSVSEWANNCVEARFKTLLENVAATPSIVYKYIVCSFPYFDIIHFPNSMKVSPRVKARIKIKAEFIQSFTASIPVIYGIPIIFFDYAEQAERFTFDYLKWIVRANA